MIFLPDPQISLSKLQTIPFLPTIPSHFFLIKSNPQFSIHHSIDIAVPYRQDFVYMSLL